MPASSTRVSRAAGSEGEPPAAATRLPRGRGQERRYRSWRVEIIPHGGMESIRVLPQADRSSPSGAVASARGRAEALEAGVRGVESRLV